MVDSGAVECVEQEACAPFENGIDTRAETWRDMELCRRKGTQEGR